ncbi:MAG: hypothetical protein U0075_08810 [Thermomicrobiales bacterium]
MTNLDNVTHRAGPFLVGAGADLRSAFPSRALSHRTAVDPLETVVVT